MAFKRGTFGRATQDWNLLNLSLVLLQVYDSNTNAEKLLRLKLGKGKAIKVNCLISNIVDIL